MSTVYINPNNGFVFYDCATDEIKPSFIPSNFTAVVLTTAQRLALESHREKGVLPDPRTISGLMN